MSLSEVGESRNLSLEKRTRSGANFNAPLCCRQQPQPSTSQPLSPFVCLRTPSHQTDWLPALEKQGKRLSVLLTEEQVYLIQGPLEASGMQVVARWASVRFFCFFSLFFPLCFLPRLGTSVSDRIYLFSPLTRR